MRKIRCILVSLAAVLLLAACSGNTQPATSVTSTSATLHAHGKCDSGSPEPCSYYFRYGTGGTYTNTTTTSGQITAPAEADVSENVTGLTPGTTYQYQICGKGDTTTSYVCVGPDGQGSTSTTFTTASSGVTCDKVASPGADLTAFDNSLAPGQTGCLHGGSYGSTSTQIFFQKSGTAGNPITIRSYPGELATIQGWLNIGHPSGAAGGDYTTLSHLSIDGSNTYANQNQTGCTRTGVSQGLQINKPNAIFEYNDYYQSVASLRGQGIGVGFNGSPDNTIIRYNKIHDAGSCTAYDHLIYQSHGNNVQIYDNWMWNEQNGWCMQIYPSPTNSIIHSNVCDHDGSGFTLAGSGSSGHDVYNNVVQNSTGLSTIGDPGSMLSGLGAGASNNKFRDSVGWNNPGGTGSTSGTTVTNITTADPKFVDPANHNYLLQAGSPAAGYGLPTTAPGP